MPRSQPVRDLEAAHRPERIERRLAAAGRGSYVGDAVLGAIDGAVTSFAVVAGAVGAGFPAVVVIVLGFASLFADGFSMAVSNFLGTKSERDAARQAHREERRHIDVVREGECEELRQIFAAKGFEGDALDRIVSAISSDRDLWAHTIVQESFGLQPVPAGKPVRAGLATFAAFLAAGAVPLVPFLIPALGLDQAFIGSIAVTTMTFAAIGAIKGRALDQAPVRAGVETLLVGGGAAGLAYGVGALLRSALGTGVAV